MPAPRTALPQSAVVEQGKFRLYKFEQPIGEEEYRISADGEGVSVTMSFRFKDRGTDVPLSSTFQATVDLTPKAFEIRGKTARQSEIDEAVDVGANEVRLRNREQWTETARPLQFFTIAGYASVTMQMLLFRYWATHGSPKELVVMPGGRVEIEPGGMDSIPLDERSELLRRYTIAGLIWGRETLWFDSGRKRIAVVTTDAEFDHSRLSVRDMKVRLRRLWSAPELKAWRHWWRSQKESPVVKPLRYCCLVER